VLNFVQLLLSQASSQQRASLTRESCGEAAGWQPLSGSIRCRYADLVEALMAGLLGACGGVLNELVELARFLKAKGHFPWSRRGRHKVVRVHGELRRYESFSVYFLAVAIRAVVGAAVAAGLSTAGALNPLAALVAGAGAYSIVDRWAASTTVDDGKAERSATAAAEASKG
jgi:hypothetical protein